MQKLDQTTAAMVALAEAGIPADVQELLVRGDPDRGIAPGAINKALNTRPAAPVEGLAVLEQVSKYPHGTYFGKDVPEGTTVVALSQAKDIIAVKEAERAEQWRLRREMEVDRDTQKAIAARIEAQLSVAMKALKKLTLHSNSLALAHVHKTQNDDGIWGALKEARAALEGVK